MLRGLPALLGDIMKAIWNRKVLTMSEKTIFFAN